MQLDARTATHAPGGFSVVYVSGVRWRDKRVAVQEAGDCERCSGVSTITDQSEAKRGKHRGERWTGVQYRKRCGESNGRRGHIPRGMDQLLFGPLAPRRA
jgi:hypothetical protein